MELSQEAPDLRARNLKVHFAGVKAVDGFDLDLTAGEIVGLIGPNGAGKTTVMNALTGFVRPTDGTVSLGDRDVGGVSPARLARMGLARTFQSVRLFGQMSVLENVEVAAIAGAGMSRRRARRRAEDLLREVGLDALSSRLADTLSFGQEQLVGLARALAMDPLFLLVDEPAAGLSNNETDQGREIIRAVSSSRRCGVLVIDHNMRMVMSLCARLYVLDAGKLLAHGTPGEIQRDPAVVAAYLGTAS